VCAIDLQCRNQCQQDIDCTTGQKCTSITHLCVDPTIDTKNYNPTTNDFYDMGDAGSSYVSADGGGSSTRGVDATVTSSGDAGATGGGADSSISGVDAAATTFVDSGASSGGADGVTIKRDAGTAVVGGTICTPGQAPTNFGNVATSASNPNYTSGVGLLTATEFLIFNGYAGPDSVDGGVADASTATLVNRIDVQHFDPISGKSKASATALLMAEGDGTGLYINGADIAPTGEIAISYTVRRASTGTWSTYLAFLDKNLAVIRTTQFVAWGSINYSSQSYVKWLNGAFVATAVVAARNIKLGKFAVDGSSVGGTNAISTDDPSSLVAGGNYGEGEVAFSGGLFAAAYLTNDVSGNPPYLTVLDPLGMSVGSPPVRLPASYAYFVAVAGTSLGFVAVYDGTSSLLATFVSNSASGDAGIPVGTPYAFPGGSSYNNTGGLSARGSSDGTGAGFAVLYPDGSVTFLYFGENGAPRGTPQTVLYQTNAAGPQDEVQVTNFGGTFAASLYSSAEHLTRLVATTCR
jgi:hypothetical protein